MIGTSMTEIPGRILAIDYGSKRVGVAASDPTRMIAQGITTLSNDATLFARLKDIIADQAVTHIVVGMPYSADGGKGAKALEVEEFIGKLRLHTDVPIDTWDESYTSVDAHRVFIEAGMKKKQRREKARVDEMAARLMLQEYLDYRTGK
jgi:putative Holliday junction resolvase